MEGERVRQALGASRLADAVEVAVAPLQLLCVSGRASVFVVLLACVRACVLDAREREREGKTEREREREKIGRAHV